MARMVERYQAGEHRQVWDELVALGPTVFEPRWYAEATAVAAVTMDRVAANLATIVERLNRMDYRFAQAYWRNQTLRSSPDHAQLRTAVLAAGDDPTWIDQGGADQFHYRWTPRRGTHLEQVDRAGQICGPLPISLRAMWSMVGQLSLLGSFRSWAPSAYLFEDEFPWPDPGLVSAPLDLNDERALLAYCLPGADELAPAYRDDTGRFALALGADEVHGAGFSGGTHTIVLPQPTADPVIHGVHGHEGIRLVEYLRLCLAWGGFPGLAGTQPVPTEITALRAGLAPI